MHMSCTNNVNQYVLLLLNKNTQIYMYMIYIMYMYMQTWMYRAKYSVIHNDCNISTKGGNYNIINGVLHKCYTNCKIIILSSFKSYCNDYIGY